MVKLRGRKYTGSCASQGEKEMNLKKRCLLAEQNVSLRENEESLEALYISNCLFIFSVPVTSESLHSEQ